MQGSKRPAFFFYMLYHCINELQRDIVKASLETWRVDFHGRDMTFSGKILLLTVKEVPIYSL